MSIAQDSPAVKINPRWTIFTIRVCGNSDIVQFWHGDLNKLVEFTPTAASAERLFHLVANADKHGLKAVACFYHGSKKPYQHGFATLELNFVRRTEANDGH